jgi:hypothetical protein
MKWEVVVGHRLAATVFLAVLLAGVIIGISLVAQPVKFTASGVALAQQVRIGSVIFHASH